VGDAIGDGPRDLQKQPDTLRQADIPDCQDELTEANKRVRQGREQSPIRDQINKNVTEIKRIARTSDAAQPTSPAIEKLRQKSRATITTVTNTMTHFETAIHQRQEREKLLEVTDDRKLLPAVTALSKDFFELASLERENWEILGDSSDLHRTLADDQPTDLLSDFERPSSRSSLEMRAISNLQIAGRGRSIPHWLRPGNQKETKLRARRKGRQSRTDNSDH
jgi:hypothetical protein